MEKIETYRQHLVLSVPSFYNLSFLPSFLLSFPFKMPSKRGFTKKGRLSGSACKELNSIAASKVVERSIVGTNEDTAFARVVRMMGFGHARVIVQVSSGTKELLARIPKNKFGKKGSTPITTNSVVTIFVGKDFDPSSMSQGDHFDITSILDDRQLRDLIAKQIVPSWMLKSVEDIANGIGLIKVTEDDGFDWENSDSETDEITSGAALTRKQLRAAKKTKLKKLEDATEVPDEDMNDLIDCI